MKRLASKKEKKGRPLKRRKGEFDDFLVDDDEDIIVEKKSTEEYFYDEISPLLVADGLTRLCQQHYKNNISRLEDDVPAYKNKNVLTNYIKNGIGETNYSNLMGDWSRAHMRAALGAWAAHDHQLLTARNDAFLKRCLMAKLDKSVSEKNKFNIKFIHVGQGDCTFIQTSGGKNILIDCGSSGGLVVKNKPAGVSNDFESVVRDITDLTGDKKNATLSVLILTHPDKDHYNLLVDIINRCFTTVLRVYHSIPLLNYKKLSAHLRNFKNPPEGTGPRIRRVSMGNISCALRDSSLDGKEDKVVVPRKKSTQPDDKQVEWLDGHGALVIFDDSVCVVRILASEIGVTSENKNLESARNTGSVVVLVEAYGKKILICGDATQETHEYLLQKYSTNHLSAPIDILRCSHHGSDEEGCNPKKLIKAVKPKEFIASASYDANPMHGLPALETLKRGWGHVQSVRTLRGMKPEEAGAEHDTAFWVKLNEFGHRSHDTVITNVNKQLTADDSTKFSELAVWATGSNGTLVRVFGHSGKDEAL